VCQATSSALPHRIRQQAGSYSWNPVRKCPIEPNREAPIPNPEP
jgi:hypothetical protein